MSENANVRVRQEDRDMLIRVVRLVMSDGRRHSFMERSDRLEDYEDALYEGRGKEILDELEAYRKNRQLLPEQDREAEDLSICLERRIKEIRQAQKEEMEQEEELLIGGGTQRL